jgi:ABC-type transporter Mla subunit MlaD
MHQVEDRLERLEKKPPGLNADPAALQRLEQTQRAVMDQTNQLRQQISQEVQLRNQQIAQLAQHLDAASRKLHEASVGIERQDRQLEQHLSAHLEHISAAMAARIDARVREILQHLQTELVHWKGQVDRDVQGVRDEKADREELQNRFARLASAAMEGDLPKSTESGDGFLL